MPRTRMAGILRVERMPGLPGRAVAAILLGFVKAWPASKPSLSTAQSRPITHQQEKGKIRP